MCYYYYSSLDSKRSVLFSVCKFFFIRFLCWPHRGEYPHPRTKITHIICVSHRAIVFRAYNILLCAFFRVLLLVSTFLSIRTRYLNSWRCSHLFHFFFGRENILADYFFFCNHRSAHFESKFFFTLRRVLFFFSSRAGARFLKFDSRNFDAVPSRMCCLSRLILRMNLS